MTAELLGSGLSRRRHYWSIDWCGTGESGKNAAANFFSDESVDSGGSRRATGTNRTEESEKKATVNSSYESVGSGGSGGAVGTILALGTIMSVITL